MKSSFKVFFFGSSSSSSVVSCLPFLGSSPTTYPFLQQRATAVSLLPLVLSSVSFSLLRSPTRRRVSTPLSAHESSFQFLDSNRVRCKQNWQAKRNKALKLFVCFMVIASYFCSPSPFLWRFWAAPVCFLSHAGAQRTGGCRNREELASLQRQAQWRPPAPDHAF